MSFVKSSPPLIRGQKSGFTLIEVMVVLLVVGILIGITFAGANYVISAQQEKQALANIEVLRLALEEFKTEFGDYPRTDDLSGDEDALASLGGKRLFQVLSGYAQQDGDPYEDPATRPKSFLRSDALSLAEQDGKHVRRVILDLTEFAGGQIPDYFAIDPWDSPYIYEYPRRDGHLGYLLFSKGPDMKTSEFTSEQTAPHEREPEDYDNLPANEPGKW